MHPIGPQNTVTVTVTPRNILSPAVDQQVIPLTIAQQVEPHTPSASGLVYILIA